MLCTCVCACLCVYKHSIIHKYNVHSVCVYDLQKSQIHVIRAKFHNTKQLSQRNYNIWQHFHLTIFLIYYIREGIRDIASQFHSSEACSYIGERFTMQWNFHRILFSNHRKLPATSWSGLSTSMHYWRSTSDWRQKCSGRVC